MEPTIAAIAKKYNVDKKICRKCYARLVNINIFIYKIKIYLLDYHQKPIIVVRESADTPIN